MQDIDILTDQHDLRTTDNYCTFYARDYKQQLVHWFQLLFKMRSFKLKNERKMFANNFIFCKASNVKRKGHMALLYSYRIQLSFEV